ncbi:MAG: GNAT family N-acetyltransferase [Sarcina sp.]
MEFNERSEVNTLFMGIIPRFESENYIVRKIVISDWEDLIEIYQNRFLHEYGNTPYIYTEKMAINLITGIEYNYAMGRGAAWSIEDKNTKECIGILSLNNVSINDKKTEIGYGLKEIHMNKGIMSEVFPVFLDNIVSYGFYRIEANIDVNNIASINLCESNGFLQEGIRRKYIFNLEKQVFSDSYIYAKVI